MHDLMKSFVKDPNIVSRKIAGEVILVPIRKNVGDLESIYTLNEVAARIWEFPRLYGQSDKLFFFFFRLAFSSPSEPA